VTLKPRKNNIKVTRRPLGRENALGLAYQDAHHVVLEKNLTAFTEMDTFIHEFLHIADKRMKEEKVNRIATILAENMWRQGYRKVILK
jgi:hypothetical protein